MERRKLDFMPFDKRFEVKNNGQTELCHATGYEVKFDDMPDDWWNEYISSDGEYYYGR